MIIIFLRNINTKLLNITLDVWKKNLKNVLIDLEKVYHRLVGHLFHKSERICTFFVIIICYLHFTFESSCLLIAFHFLSMAGWQLDFAMISWIRDLFRVAVNCFEFPVAVNCFQEWELLLMAWSDTNS